MRGLKELKKNKKQGIALPFAACAGAFLLAFALALTYTAGVMLSNANGRLAKERCYRLAKSFAGVVGGELEKPESEFCGFANRFLDDPAYNEYHADHPETSYHYTLTTEEDADYGKVALQLRKELNEEGLAGLEGSIPPPSGDDTNYTAMIKAISEMKFLRYILTVEVTAKKGNLAYDYATEYYREDQYSVVFRYDGREIVWDTEANQWKYGTTAGTACEFNNPEMKITYTYDTGEAKESRFLPLHEEGGASG